MISNIVKQAVPNRWFRNSEWTCSVCWPFDWRHWGIL